ncbi:MAG TPA: alpha-amylase family glycosyl hydrolase [Treponemataceae bacterium]|nr:alpha-amylase family glycosyl hydrolase [Treponemataceae bacterium]
MISSNDFFYHIYPLGMLGCPERNERTSVTNHALRRIADFIPHLQSIGVTAVYLGPLFESSSHGYDTVDYRLVDRRLGSNEDLVWLVSRFHEGGIKVVLDAVLNHTGRDFFAFQDLRNRGPTSEYRAWYRGVDFSKRSPEGDSFSYEGWSGHFSLAKLNTDAPAVREHLVEATIGWIDEFGIDGLRLDAADVLDPGFMDYLAARCRARKPGFWLMGEVVHGDYRHWARAGRLDSTTNYELYKGLWSSLNDGNLFEIAWTLDRQWGPTGLYRDIPLYNFADNHDVNRVASSLKEAAHLYVLYGMLFTAPGIPSLYYGSEWGIRGIKANGSDAALRPAIESPSSAIRFARLAPDCMPPTDPDALLGAIARFARLRREVAALRSFDYRQLHVSSLQLAYERGSGTEAVIVAVNASKKPASVRIADASTGDSAARWMDLLDPGYEARSAGGGLTVSVPPTWLRVLARR